MKQKMMIPKVLLSIVVMVVMLITVFRVIPTAAETKKHPEPLLAASNVEPTKSTEPTEVTICTSADNITYEQGKKKETAPLIVSKEENSYSIKKPDSDKDGVPDEYEILFGIDENKEDTDGDGLSDYEELCVTATDPTVFDSVEKGVSDAEADLDKDGLSNKEELQYGTDTTKADTDRDGLSDYEEMHVYATNPGEMDTDNDNLKDGDETALGLDPKNPKTYEISDAEYTVKQTVDADSEALKEINTEENPYRLSIDVTAAGYLEGNLTAKETGYAAVIQNEYIIGMAFELSYKMEDYIESVTLTFELEEEVIGNALGLFPEIEEFSGIWRFNVFKYFEDINMLLPIETEVDVEHNRISATTDELGTYCVVDMERWLASFDIPEEIYRETER